MSGLSALFSQAPQLHGAAESAFICYPTSSLGWLGSQEGVCMGGAFWKKQGPVRGVRMAVVGSGCGEQASLVRSCSVALAVGFLMENLRLPVQAGK